MNYFGNLETKALDILDGLIDVTTEIHNDFVNLTLHERFLLLATLIHMIDLVIERNPTPRVINRDSLGCTKTICLGIGHYLHGSAPCEEYIKMRDYKLIPLIEKWATRNKPKH